MISLKNNHWMIPNWFKGRVTKVLPGIINVCTILNYKQKVTFPGE